MLPLVGNDGNYPDQSDVSKASLILFSESQIIGGGMGMGHRDLGQCFTVFNVHMSCLGLLFKHRF